MSMKIRLARGGSKKRPFYRVVAADSRMPRDGRFIEKLGTYNPLLAKDSEERVQIDMERVQYWLSKGAQPTDRVARMLEAAGVLPAKSRSNPVKPFQAKRLWSALKKKQPRRPLRWKKRPQQKKLQRKSNLPRSTTCALKNNGPRLFGGVFHFEVSH